MKQTPGPLNLQEHLDEMVQTLTLLKGNNQPDSEDPSPEAQSRENQKRAASEQQEEQYNTLYDQLDKALQATDVGYKQKLMLLINRHSREDFNIEHDLNIRSNRTMYDGQSSRYIQYDNTKDSHDSSNKRFIEEACSDIITKIEAIKKNIGDTPIMVGNLDEDGKNIGINSMIKQCVNLGTNQEAVIKAFADSKAHLYPQNLEKYNSLEQNITAKQTQAQAEQTQRETTISTLISNCSDLNQQYLEKTEATDKAECIHEIEKKLLNIHELSDVSNANDDKANLIYNLNKTGRKLKEIRQFHQEQLATRSLSSFIKYCFNSKSDEYSRKSIDQATSAYHNQILKVSQAIVTNNDQGIKQLTDKLKTDQDALQKHLERLKENVGWTSNNYHTVEKPDILENS
ncbi:MAG: hypothetical protein VXY77_02575 [Pseudomonadota bacterium]|nr:hypothetical protein [Pseudomonadota bacterium]